MSRLPAMLQHTERHLRFRIDALLRLQPEPEQVVFDSELEPISSTVEIKAPGS